jgi:OST-HTH/LOTUS domain
LSEAPTIEEPGCADLRPAAAKQPPSVAVHLIRKTIAQLDDEDGWVPLGRVGHRLAELASDFDPRTYPLRYRNGGSTIRLELQVFLLFLGIPKHREAMAESWLEWPDTLGRPACKCVVR